VNQERQQELLVADVQPENGVSATNPSRDIALSYLRLANLDNELIDRLSRYEGSLWRQVVQTLFTLQALKRRRTQPMMARLRSTVYWVRFVETGVRLYCKEEPFCETKPIM